MSTPAIATVYGQVEHRERIAPRLVRLVLGGAGLDGFTSTGFTDEYVNVQFPPADADYVVPFDVAEARARGAGGRPIARRFTVRAWDEGTRRLTIDFVTHGDEGVGGRWAEHAEVGDLLQFVGPSGGYTPDPAADWHLMVGDESALPAIAASLEAVPAGRPAVAVLVVDGPDHEIPLDSPGELAVHWLHRNGQVDSTERLVQTIAALALPEGQVHGFIHGEASETRAVRKHLLLERDLPKERLSISPYWRRTYTDEGWREVKRDWLAEMAQDV